MQAPIPLTAVGTDIIARERWQQVYAHGCTLKNDREYRDDELTKAAACYALPHYIRLPAGAAPSERAAPVLWPWPAGSWRPRFTPVIKDHRVAAVPPRTEDQLEGRIRELAKAGALIAAEIDRLQAKRIELADDADAEAAGQTTP